MVFYFVAKYVHGIHVQQNPNNVLGLSVTFVWLALLFAVVNAILRPVFKLLSLPFVILTLGLFYLVINAALLGITAALSHASCRSTASCAAVVGGLLPGAGQLGGRPGARPGLTPPPVRRRDAATRTRG